MIRIAVAADHAGYVLKEKIKAHLAKKGVAVVDFGTDSEDPVDYPDLIRPAAQRVGAGTLGAGIVFGGSGNGEAMAANKIAGVRCAVCWNMESARLAKAHNNANMIAIGARLVAPRLAVEMVDVWLQTTFAGGRHRRRIAKLE